MKIWLDTIAFDVIADSVKTGMISGVTTNPSILAGAGNVPKTLRHILELQPGPVAVQVTSKDAEGMIEEGKRIFDFSDRMVVKIPVNYNGLIAMEVLQKEGIPLLGTAVVLPVQALLVRNHDLPYMSPYFSHMGENAKEALQKMQEILKNAKTKILAASFREVEQILTCALLGIEMATIKPNLYKELVENHAVVEAFVERFSTEWSQRHGIVSIKELLS